MQSGLMKQSRTNPLYYGHTELDLIISWFGFKLIT